MALAGVTGLVYTQSVFADDDAKTPPAEGKHHGQGQHGNPVEMLTKALNLTADQQTQVKAIFDETQPQRKAIWEDKALSKEDKAAKMKELHTTTFAKVRALLTAEQQTAFDALQQKHEQGPGGHHKAPASDQ